MAVDRREVPSYVERNDSDTEDDNPDRDVQVRPPVRDEDAGDRQVVGQNDHVFEEVVPSSCEPIGGFLSAGIGHGSQKP